MIAKVSRNSRHIILFALTYFKVHFEKQEV